MDSVEVPEFFICPISLEVMQDPVTTITGISYERESIERWLFLDDNQSTSLCPVTKQQLPKDSVLTPNHILRRLIETWFNNTSKASSQNFQQLVLKPIVKPAEKHMISELICNLSDRRLQIDALRKLAAMASESKSNCWFMVQSGVADRMVELITTSCNHGNEVTDEIVFALSIIQSLRIPADYLKSLVESNFFDLINSITWVLQHASRPDNLEMVRSTAIVLLNSIVEIATITQLKLLKFDFFRAIVHVIHKQISQQTTKAALSILSLVCSIGRNRAMAVEAGAVKVVIELELSIPDKRTTELNFMVLNNLCRCAAGRAELMGHGAGIALVSKRILRISSVVDDQAVKILSAVCMYSVSNEVLQEMLRVGAVSKLCFVLQANCSSSVKDKASSILKLHSWAWKNSPCIHKYLVFRYPCT